MLPCQGAFSIQDPSIAPENGIIVRPVIGSLTLPYRISKETLHRTDMSPRINGIWLDKGEWVPLKQK